MVRWIRRHCPPGHRIRNSSPDCLRPSTLPLGSVIYRALGKWILLYVAFCTIMAISRQKETRSRDNALLLSNDFNGSLWCTVMLPYTAHCTLQAFGQFGALYICTISLTNIPPDRDSSFAPQPDRMGHRDRLILWQSIGQRVKFTRTRDPGQMSEQCRATVYHAGPTIKQHCVSASWRWSVARKKREPDPMLA